MDAVESLRAQVNGVWPNIDRAWQQTIELRKKLEALVEFASEDASIVVFGSVGRGEVTEASDIDWTLLIDGPSDPNHAHLVVKIRERLESLKLDKPGRTETFGVMAFSHDLVHHIAGTHDTNQNLTRRLLLLLESFAVTSPLACGNVVRNVLDRYITHDIVAPLPEPPKHIIPHFLLNDVVRYGRTMASDYAAKMWERQNEGWGLRNIKLRFSRKLIFVAGLLACFSMELEPPEDVAVIRRDRENLPSVLADHVLSKLARTPLDALASVLLTRASDQTARGIFDAYDHFLGIMLDAEKRAELKALRIDRALDSRVWLEARDASHDFRDGLEKLFLTDEGPLRDLTLRFGVF